MHIFKSRKRWNPDTGDELEPILVPDRTFCDYCGDEIPQDDPMYAPAVAYHIHEIGGCEHMYHEDVVEIDGQRVDLYHLYETQPHFYYCTDWQERLSCERRLILEWVTSVFKKDMKVSVVKSVDKMLKEVGLKRMPGRTNDFLAPAMYTARHRVIHKLIKKGFTPQEIGLTFC